MKVHLQTLARKVLVKALNILSFTISEAVGPNSLALGVVLYLGNHSSNTHLFAATAWGMLAVNKKRVAATGKWQQMLNSSNTH